MKKIILGCLMVIMASACEDMLVEVPKNFISAGNFYTNTQEIEDGLVGAYNSMWSGIEGNQWKNFQALHSDYGTASGSFTSIGNWDAPIAPDSYSRINRFWLGYYQQINRANIILGRAPLIENMNESTRARILAEAYFLRAYAYFDFVRYWGPVPLRTEEFNGASELGVPRAPKDQVYDLIINDLLIAEKDCQEDVGNNTQRASKWAAKILLAEVYLDKEDWTKAAEKAEEVISSNRF
ncbi:MAG: RagB/SusD family nutrient uptake outer membrane protein, partial [Bacteroidales bacterium]